MTNQTSVYIIRRFISPFFIMSKTAQRILLLLVWIIALFSILSYFKLRGSYEMLDDISTQNYRINYWLDSIYYNRLSNLDDYLSQIQYNTLDASLDLNYIRKSF